MTPSQPDKYWGREVRAGRILRLGLILTVLLVNLTGPALAAEPQQADLPEVILNAMTPAEKVGQLFLVTFNGTDVSPESKIGQLILEKHIGGVVLRSDQDNFTADQTVTSAYELISALQTLAWQGASVANEAGEPQTGPTYVPLYVGIHQSLNGSGRQILSGLSDLPSPMALGASWSPALAAQVGSVAGSELSALGFNLYLGPNLDVVSSTELSSAVYAGTDTFGGDPFWVGEMGKAFVSGVHTGSGGRMSVVATHFPGLGEADRPVDEEVSTIQKSLEQLKQIELAPYLTVTGGTDASARVDGLMVSPIRYQGFQGNIRATTRPVSFDQAALNELLAVEPLASWRAAGGLTVSDSLGSRAVRQFFDPTEQNFDAVTISRTAFLAGNDMLYLNNMLAKGDVDAYATIARVLDHFTQKYIEDSLFSQRVDASVLRILQAKSKLYTEFQLETVIPDAHGLEALGTGTQASLAAAQAAVTLISPSQEYLKTLVTEPPSSYDYITIFTDSRLQRQCSSCPAVSSPGVKEFQDSLLRLYGPNGTGQISNNRVSSYSFEQLLELLDQKTEPSDPYLADNLKRSEWVVFNLQDVDPDFPSSLALRRILAERVDLLGDKRVIVFAYGAPYYLDSTEISKVTAYYALYSKAAAFRDVAARVLMGEVEARGALPVSLSVVGYDLRVATSPDPNQIIALSLLTAQAPDPNAIPTPSGEETPAPLFRTGDVVRVQAGAIRDHNQRLVPDGTVVRFTIRQAEEQVIVAQPEATTVGGMAVIEYRIDHEGIIEVSASSEPANTSGVLVLNTQGGSAQLILPTATPEPTSTPTLTPQSTPEATMQPTLPASGIPSGYPRIEDWLLTLMILILGFGAAYALGYFWWGGQVWGLRSGICTAIGGFAAYTLLTLGFPDIISWIQQSGAGFVAQVTLVGMVLGWLGALVWWLRQSH